MPIGNARLLPDGLAVTIEGVLTTAHGALEGHRSEFVEDATGGIGLYLDAPASHTYPRGLLIRAHGELGTRYGQRVLRVSEAEITPLASADLPDPLVRSTGSLGESEEGRRVSIEARLLERPVAIADGLAADVDDGSGPVRLVVAVAIAPADLTTGALVRVVGPLGQRDSGDGGGYRIYALEAGDLELLAPPPTPTPHPTASPSPTATPSVTIGPSPSASASPKPSTTPKPSPTPKPSATPSPGPSLIAIADARAAEIGTVVHVAGVVTIAPGGLGALNLVAIQDATGGIVVRLPAAQQVSVGTRLDVVGPLAAPYGQQEVRPTGSGWRTVGTEAVPAPRPLAGELDEESEGWLVEVEGTLSAGPTRGANGDTSSTLDVDGTPIAVRTDGSSGVGADQLTRGGRYRLVGVVGQRASGSGREDGYRLWIRTPEDVTLVEAAPTPTPSASPTPKPTKSPRASETAGSSPASSPTRATPTGRPAPALSTIGRAIAGGGTVRVEGVVTAGPGLLDSDGRTIVIQDRSAAVAIRLPADVPAPRVNDRLSVIGEVGRAFGAPRIAAEAVAVLGRGTSPAPAILKTQPSAAIEWRLATVSGTVERVTRDGTAWKADLLAGTQRIVIAGIAGSGIASTALVAGARATISGIVRRPHPSASDRRFAVVPRSSDDVHASVALPSASGRGTTSATSRPGAAAGRSPTPAGEPAAPSAAADASGSVRDAELASLERWIGQRVRVGGLVVELRPGAIVIDDGSAQGLIVVDDRSAALLAILQPGDALNALGIVVEQPELAVLVDDPAGLMPVTAVLTEAQVAPVASAPPTEGAPPPDAAVAAAARRPAVSGNEIALFGLTLVVAGAGALALVRRRQLARLATVVPPETAVSA